MLNSEISDVMEGAIRNQVFPGGVVGYILAKISPDWNQITPW